MTDLQIWTIGHSTRSIEDFLELLISNNIELVADVRSLPGSRKYPHFNSEVLSETLKKNGISYVLMKDLGGRRPTRSDSPNTVWRNKAFRGYADYMETENFKHGVAKLLDSARSKRTAIMCAEAVWWRCHRSMIADYLKASGVIVEHILANRSNVIHPYTAAARLRNGALVYGAET